MPRPNDITHHQILSLGSDPGLRYAEDARYLAAHRNLQSLVTHHAII